MNTRNSTSFREPRQSSVLRSPPGLPASRKKILWREGIWTEFSHVYKAAEVEHEVEQRLDALIDEKRRLTDPDNRRMAKQLRKPREHLLRFLYFDITIYIKRRKLMNRKIFWLVSVVLLWTMSVLSLGNAQAQTQDRVAKFNALGNPVDSAMTETGGNVGLGTATPAVMGISTDSVGVVGQSNNDYSSGVYGFNMSATGGIGVWGYSSIFFLKEMLVCAMVNLPWFLREVYHSSLKFS